MAIAYQLHPALITRQENIILSQLSCHRKYPKGLEDTIT